MTADEVAKLLRRHGQEHLLQFASELADADRAALFQQIQSLDFDWLSKLYAQSQEPQLALNPNAIAPIDAIPLEPDELTLVRARDAGLDAIKQGKVAAVLVAGGQGTRLGFAHPKGMFPIGPVAKTSLFQIFAEKLLAWRQRVGVAIPWYIMTSPENHVETARYFAHHEFFGLSPKTVRFFQQGTFPALDLETGKVLLADRGELFSSPNGHGGALLALRDEGVLDDMDRKGVELVYYFQVDNPLANVCDPTFLGHHRLADAEMSVKVVRKRNPAEKVGVLARYDNRPTVIEYSDLPTEMARLADDRGELLLWAGSIAIHAFNRDFLERSAAAATELPMHFARKSAPFIDPAGVVRAPKEANALKFEMFIFDLLPRARQACVVETARELEFMPVKNASGADSVATAQSAMTRQAGEWLRHAGVEFPTTPEGEPAVALEISPLAGLDADDFARRLRPERRRPITGPTYFGRDCVVDG